MNPEVQLSRAVIQAQKEQYLKGRDKVVSEVSAYNGAIEAMDNLLSILDQKEEALAKAEEQGDQAEE